MTLTEAIKISREFGQTGTEEQKHAFDLVLQSTQIFSDLAYHLARREDLGYWYQKIAIDAIHQVAALDQPKPENEDDQKK